VTILDCFEEQRACLTPQRKTSPLWNAQGSFVNAGDDEAEMVGQGLCGSIEAALEWHTDDDRGEECVLDDLSSPCCFGEGVVRSANRRHEAVCACRGGAALLLRST
jgi:hypothetical protein